MYEGISFPENPISIRGHPPETYYSVALNRDHTVHSYFTHLYYFHKSTVAVSLLLRSRRSHTFSSRIDLMRVTHL